MFTRAWFLVVLAIVLIAGHGLILCFALQHRGLSAAAVAGGIILILAMHLGFLTRLYALLRRRSGQ